MLTASMGGCCGGIESKFWNRKLKLTDYGELDQFFNDVVTRAGFKQPTAVKLLQLAESLIQLFVESPTVSIAAFLRVCEFHRQQGISSQDFNQFIDEFTVRCAENSLTDEMSRRLLMKMAWYLTRSRYSESPAASIVNEPEPIESYPKFTRRVSSIRLGDVVASPSVTEVCSEKVGNTTIDLHAIGHKEDSVTVSKTREQTNFLPPSHHDREEKKRAKVLKRVLDNKHLTEFSYVIPREVSRRPLEVSCETSTDMVWCDNFFSATQRSTSRISRVCYTL